MGRPSVQRDEDEHRAGHLIEGVPMPAVPTVQKRAATQALVEQERVLAQPNRSGVRAIAAPRVPDESGIDLSNAVTKVQPAIDLDAILREQQQAEIVVSGTVSLEGPAPKSVPPLGPDEVTERVVLPVNPPVPSVETARFDTRVMSQLLADATAAHNASLAVTHRPEAPQEQADDRITTPPRRRSRLRKFVGALLVLLVMGGAFALLVVAASRADQKLPPDVVHAAQRLVALARR
jgi:hypothetical protein